MYAGMEEHWRITNPQLQRRGEMAQRLLGTIAMARALVLGGRIVDLSGLNDRIGALSAQLLDMPWEESRMLLPQLHGMVVELDRLALAMRNASGANP